MAKRLRTKIGDIFSVPINSKEKRYMQLVAFDLLQLNSDVIRCFVRRYPIEASPHIDEIVNDEVLFYAHCSADFGLKLKLWSIIGNSDNIGSPENVIFRGTQDYARKEGTEPITVSDNWYVWQINDGAFRNVGKLAGKNRGAFIGLVFNPYGILELVKGNKYPLNYPEFDE